MGNIPSNRIKCVGNHRNLKEAKMEAQPINKELIQKFSSNLEKVEVSIPTEVKKHFAFMAIVNEQGQVVAVLKPNGNPVELDDNSPKPFPNWNGSPPWKLYLLPAVSPLGCWTFNGKWV
jgi:hypothetical protein